MLRYPAVAGTFYPSDPKELDLFVEELLGQRIPEEKIIGAVVPHAGYIYSGKVAAEVYRRIPEREKIVVVGPNHTGIGPGISVFPEGEWVTPFGRVKIDEETVEEIVEKTSAVKDAEAHVFEHSVEVQVPFLQKVLKNFFLTPIVMLDQSFEKCKELSEAIPEDVLLIASSDFSHYVPDAMAREEDGKLIEKIVEMDAEGFYESAKEKTVCGYGPITALILWAKRQGAKAELLRYSTSGEVNKDFSSVVGYAAIVFKKP